MFSHLSTPSPNQFSGRPIRDHPEVHRWAREIEALDPASPIRREKQSFRVSLEEFTSGEA